MTKVFLGLILAFISGVCFMCNFITALSNDKSLRWSAIVLSILFFGMAYVLVATM